MKKFSCAALFFLSCSVYADTTCGPYAVTGIQIQKYDVLVRIKSITGGVYWKQIGRWDTASTKPYLALVMQAYAMKKKIVFRYTGDEYVCDVTDYGVVPTLVRLEEE